MTQIFAFQIWVPHQQMRAAVALVAQRGAYGELEGVVWPNGRLLAPDTEPLRADPSRARPKKQRLWDRNREYTLSLRFAEDEELREADQQEAREAREHNRRILREWKAEHAPTTGAKLSWLERLAARHSPEESDRAIDDALRNEAELPPQVRAQLTQKSNMVFDEGDGFFDVYGFNFACNAPWWNSRQWLDGDADLVLLTFSGSGTTLSYLMRDSPSIQRYFIELAREMGAYSCVFDREGPGRLLYLEGHEYHADFDDIESPFALRALASRPQSADARRMDELARPWTQSSVSQPNDELRGATRDANSGIRAQALKTLGEYDLPGAGAAIERALSDGDARVREVAVALYDGDAAPLLSLMRDDADAGVRLRAIEALAEWPAAHGALHELLLQTPTRDHYASIVTAFTALRKQLSDYDFRQLAQDALARPDFPFRGAAHELRTLDEIETAASN